MSETDQNKLDPSPGTPEIDPMEHDLLLTGADIAELGASAELLVGGKNYNTALISQIKGIKAPQFRAIASEAFHILLDESLAADGG